MFKTFSANWVCALVYLSTSTLSTDFICSPRSDPELLLPSAHMDCQVKKARVKGQSGSRPVDARPRDPSLKQNLYARASSSTQNEAFCSEDPAAGKMKAKAYSGSHFPRILTAATKGDAARESTLPDQLWALSWASVSFFCSSPPSLPQKHSYGL